MSVPGPDSSNLILSPGPVSGALFFVRNFSSGPLHPTRSVSPQYFNELLLDPSGKNPPDLSFRQGHLPKRLQIYDCFPSRQTFSKKKSFSFGRPEKKDRAPQLLKNFSRPSDTLVPRLRGANVTAFFQYTTIKTKLFSKFSKVIAQQLMK
jgi:hypothetical protein